MSDFLDFNLNDTIRVQLNGEGHQTLRREHAELMAHLPPKCRWDYLPPREDSDGWSEFQAWRFMQVFGHHIGPGRTSPFNNNIQVEKR